MLQRLYRRVLALAASANAPWWLAAVAFAESSFFPIPPDALLVPMALARPLLDAYGYQAAFARFQATYAQYGLWVILVKGLTPIPYKIVTIASGAARFNFWLFMAASLVTRGLRFFLLAALLRRFGAPVRDFIERRLTLVTSAVAAGIVGGFLVLRFL